MYHPINKPHAFSHGDRGDFLTDEIHRLHVSLKAISFSIRMWSKEAKCDPPFFGGGAKALAKHLSGLRQLYAEIFQRREELRAEYHAHYQDCYDAWKES